MQAPNKQTNNNANSNPQGKGGKKKNRPSKKQRRAATRGQLQLSGTQTVNFQTAQEFRISTGSTPGGIRIRGREMLSAVLQGDSEAFDVSSTLLNPFVPPRLASLAPAWEEFLFHTATLIYQPSLPTTVGGAVSVWADYDALDVVATTQATAARNISYSISNAYAANSCRVLGSLSRLKRYICTTSVDQPLQTTQAKLYVATEGIPIASAPAGSQIGYLFLEYDLEFFTPQ